VCSGRETQVSIVAIVIYAVTFVVSYRASKVAERRARLLVLVFVCDDTQGWLLRK
jgi:hypothetical protein